MKSESIKTHRNNWWRKNGETALLMAALLALNGLCVYGFLYLQYQSELAAVTDGFRSGSGLNRLSDQVFLISVPVVLAILMDVSLTLKKVLLTKT